MRTRPEPLVPPSLPALLTPDALPAVERLAVRQAQLLELRPGMYTTSNPEAAPGLARRDLVLARVAAAKSSLGTDYWFSHATAALLHGLWTYRLADRVHLTQLYPPQIRREDDSWDHRYRVTRHWTRLPHRDRDVVNGLPVTTLERTAVDCARSLGPAPALVVVDSALHNGADRAIIEQILRESRGKRGVVQARRIFDLADDGAESPGESLVRLMMIEQGFPRPETQVPVETALGVKWVDVGWPEARVGIEFDGEIKYTDLADGDPEGVQRRELSRHAAIEAEGWRLTRAAWPDVDQETLFLDRVHEAFAGRWHLLPRRRSLLSGAR